MTEFPSNLKLASAPLASRASRTPRSCNTPPSSAPSLVTSYIGNPEARSREPFPLERRLRLLRLGRLGSLVCTQSLGSRFAFNRISIRLIGRWNSFKVIFRWSKLNISSRVSVPKPSSNFICWWASTKSAYFLTWLSCFSILARCFWNSLRRLNKSLRVRSTVFFE